MTEELEKAVEVVYRFLCENYLQQNFWLVLDREEELPPIMLRASLHMEGEDEVGDLEWEGDEPSETVH